MSLYHAIRDLLVIHGQCDAFQLAMFTGRDINAVAEELKANRFLYRIHDGKITYFDSTSVRQKMAKLGYWLGYPHGHDYDDNPLAVEAWTVEPGTANAERIGEYWDDIVVERYSKTWGKTHYFIDVTHQPLLEQLDFIFDEIVLEEKAWNLR